MSGDGRVHAGVVPQPAVELIEVVSSSESNTPVQVAGFHGAVTVSVSAVVPGIERGVSFARQHRRCATGRSMREEFVNETPWFPTTTSLPETEFGYINDILT